ncbi:MAG: UvrD-helicase domain-containing protein [Solirubrobacteraceae bacterium MAG38_C4-C5]|nr:UvrD-helicase domain-containing protein [Candidatus Siliceabacter maunaloa]
MRLTPEQRAAVERREGPLLLEATAGSGKTSVLVERFVAMVREDAIEPGRILAITFTHKAAGELRERVRRALVDLGAREAARETEAASISTIHGFCASLLRWTPVAAGLDPGFTVLDDPAARALREQAWVQALGAWLGEEGPKSAALELAAAWTPDRLGKAIKALYDQRRSAGEVRPAIPVPAPVPAPDPAALRGACDRALRELGACDAPGDHVRRALGAIEGCAADLAAGLATVGRLGDAEVRPGRTGALQGEGAVGYVTQVAAYRGALVEHRGAADLALLADLLARYATAYEAAKHAHGGLDFADLELRARDLLRDRSGLRRAVQERYARVMVDEFQDTNPLQVELLDLVAPEHLFVVGDEFQSIYGFRHADVAGFRARRAALAARGAVGALSGNFRSRAALLDVVGTAFGALLGEDFVAPRPARDDAGAVHDGPEVELLLTGKEGWNDVDLGDTLPPVDADERAEAIAVARRIRALVDDGEALPQDIVVLVRATATLGVLERALEDTGLPTYASGGRGYWSQQQVQDLRAWLQALANPDEEVALHGVLASPLVGVSADTLHHLAHTARALGWGLWRTIEGAFGGGEQLGALREALEAEDRVRLERFAPRFAAERRLAPRLALDVLLERAVASTGYDLHVLALPAGERRMANIHKLQRLAAAYEEAGGRDIGGFLRFAAEEEEAGAREPEAPIELGDLKAVRLMTIHAAKGLEFPVVVLAALGRRPNLDKPDLAVGEGEAGVRVIGFEGEGVPTATLERLTAAARERAAAEERRVLYVAATRARERLILSGTMRLDRETGIGPGAPPIAWLRPVLGERVRVVENRPEAFVAGSACTEGESGGEAPAPADVLDPLSAPAPVALTTLSPSALARHAACGYRFYLERVLELPEVDPPQAGWRITPAVRGKSANRQRGTEIHTVLEHLDLDDPQLHEGADHLRTLVNAFLSSPAKQRLARARTLRREAPFALQLKDAPILTGIVDALADEGDGRAYVVDYKTDRVTAQTDLEAKVATTYTLQRAAYALAALREGFASVEVAYLFLERPREPVGATYTQEDVRALEHRLTEAARLDFRVTDHPHLELCATCPGRGGLCLYPDALTLAPARPGTGWEEAGSAAAGPPAQPSADAPAPR